MDKQKAKRRPLSSTASLVLKILRDDRRPYSAYELKDKLRNDGVAAPVTIYRALDRLMAEGNVHRLESLNAYIACTHKHCEESSGAVFAICDDCGGVEEVSDTSVTAAAIQWAKSNTFELNAVTFELRGTCGTCRVDAESSAIGGSDVAKSS